MYFHVATTPYTVAISDRRIFNEQGDELEGCVIEGRRLIVISKFVEPERREEIAEHEFYHAWLYHVPQPKNEEEAAQLHSLVARQFRHDLEAAGGPDALKNLTPEPVAIGHPPAFKPPRLPGACRENFGPADRISCGGCESEVMCGSIHTGPAQANPHTGKFAVERWMQCEACGVVQVWCELAAPDGTPLGEFCAVPMPRLLRGSDASAWIVEHAAEPMVC